MGFDSKNDWLDAGVAAYVAAHASPVDAIQRELIEETARVTGTRAVMQIAADQGALMGLLVGIVQPRTAVEVGTFTGYSALCIARALPPGGHLLCCDVSEEWTSIARRYWERAGVADRITLRLGPAIDTLRALPADPIDLAFVDADKASYPEYFEEIVTRLRPNGVLMVDNTLWGGSVVGDAPGDEQVELFRRFNDAVAADSRVDSYILPVGDGLTLVRKKDGAD